MKRVDRAELNEGFSECKGTKTKKGDVVRTVHHELFAKIKDISAVLALFLVP